MDALAPKFRANSLKFEDQILIGSAFRSKAIARVTNELFNRKYKPVKEAKTKTKPKSSPLGPAGSPFRPLIPTTRAATHIETAGAAALNITCCHRS